MLKYRFPKETIQKLREHYDEKERIREERLNFVLKVGSQATSQRDNSGVKPGYHEVMKMAAKGCRSSFYAAARSSSSLKLKAGSSELSDDEIGKAKQMIDCYSRAYSSIRKKVALE